MTTLTACPVCATPRPPGRPRGEPWCCSTVCYKTFHRIDQPEPPSCHDAVTTPCPVCQQPFPPAGRRRFCSDACKAAAYRRRRDAAPAVVAVPADRPKRPITVYECDNCGERALGHQRCDPCSTFMRRVGIGGCCPACDEPIAIAELLQEAAT
jgi:predicted nucleic acid-binding Zn ribbon protein